MPDQLQQRFFRFPVIDVLDQSRPRILPSFFAEIAGKGARRFRDASVEPMKLVVVLAGPKDKGGSVHIE